MKIVEYAVGIIYAVVLILVVATKNIPFVPYNFYIVQSGSMDPVIKVADMIVVQRKDIYDVSDVITFKDLNNSLVTHRIVEKIENGFITKGDANRDKDRVEVSANQILGKVILVIPFIGYVIQFLQTKVGLFILVIIPALSILIFEINKLRHEKS